MDDVIAFLSATGVALGIHQHNRGPEADKQKRRLDTTLATRYGLSNPHNTLMPGPVRAERT